MLLSDQDILTYLDDGKIKISPALDLETQLGSCSIDFQLGNIFRFFEHSKYSLSILDLAFRINELMRKVEIPDSEAFTNSTR